MDWKGKRVVVTGGSSGIGLALAKRVASQGASVAIVARNAEKLEAARAAIAGVAVHGAVALAVPADVTDDDSVAAMAAQVLDTLGGVDVVVCNQGFARCAPVWSAPIEDYQRILDTNYLGHVRVVKAFVPALKAQGSGHVQLVTSMLGFMSFFGYGAYAASKFAIVGFAEALRQELLPFGVHVGVFYPPTTDTPGLAEENASKPALTWAIEGSSRKFTAEQVADEILRGIARKRFTNMIGADSWFIYWASRWAPGLVRWILDRDLWGFVRKEGVDALDRV